MTVTRAPPGHRIRLTPDSSAPSPFRAVPIARAGVPAYFVDMVGAGRLVGFAAATDLGRARGFYADVLGLAVLDETPFAVLLDGLGAQLRVTLVEEHVRAPYTVLGWEVPDIAAAVADLAGRGVEFTRYPGMDQDELGVWTAPGGAKVAWFLDPDGNNLSLSQAA
jgi:catechol 2,3-dioxygenase-like lactoylglutathione lyase family enzyme